MIQQWKDLERKIEHTMIQQWKDLKEDRTHNDTTVERLKGR
jgi:hypothetical protein